MSLRYYLSIYVLLYSIRLKQISRPWSPRTPLRILRKHLSPYRYHKSIGMDANEDIRRQISHRHLNSQPGTPLKISLSPTSNQDHNKHPNPTSVIIVQRTPSPTLRALAAPFFAVVVGIAPVPVPVSVLVPFGVLKQSSVPSIQTFGVDEALLMAATVPILPF